MKITEFTRMVHKNGGEVTFSNTSGQAVARFPFIFGYAEAVLNISCDASNVLSLSHCRAEVFEYFENTSAEIIGESRDQVLLPLQSLFSEVSGIVKSSLPKMVCTWGRGVLRNF